MHCLKGLEFLLLVIFFNFLLISLYIRLNGDLNEQQTKEIVNMIKPLFINDCRAAFYDIDGIKIDIENSNSISTQHTFCFEVIKEQIKSFSKYVSILYVDLITGVIELDEIFQLIENNPNWITIIVHPSKFMHELSTLSNIKMKTTLWGIVCNF